MKNLQNTIAGCAFILGLLNACSGEPAPDASKINEQAAQKKVEMPAHSEQEVEKKVGENLKKQVSYKIDERTGFIIDDGFDVVSTQCTICHSAKLVIQNRGNREHWKSLFVWMQKTQGLWAFPPATETRILDYLSKHYGVTEDGRRPAIPTRYRPPAAPRADVDADVLLAKAQLKVLKKALMGTLKPAMKKGPENALNACNASAPALTKSASSKSVIVGRASSKLRNIENKAPFWAEPLMRAMEASPDMPFLTVERKVDGKPALGYVEPIRMKPLCLKCHGADVAPGVQAGLKKHYPNDKATGYQAGDFRGIFWAEVNP